MNDFYPNDSLSILKEKLVIKNLWHYSEFFQFYCNERQQLFTKPIKWFLDKGLKVRGEATPHASYYSVKIPCIPARLDEAYIVAHEIEHCVIWEEGFPPIYPARSLLTDNIDILGFVKTMADELSTFLYDIKVDSKLFIYGFDLCDIHQRISEKNYEQFFRNGAPALRNKFERMVRIFRYAKRRILLEIFCIDFNPENSRYLSWYDENYPDIVRHALDIISIIREIELDQPENIRIICQRILNKFELKITPTSEGLMIIS